MHSSSGADACLPLYSFKYLDDDMEYVGVMAQDVLKVCPDAVITGQDGFYRVDYAKLGLQMVTKAEWDRSQSSIYASAIHSPEPLPGSDIRLKQDIRLLGHISPEPKPSDIRLKRSISLLGQVCVGG